VRCNSRKRLSFSGRRDKAQHSTTQTRPDLRDARLRLPRFPLAKHKGVGCSTGSSFKLRTISIPQLSLDVWERVAYYILLRRTVVVDQNETTISVEELGQAGAMSGFKAREVLRSLNEKGCVTIIERNRSGHRLRVFLPEEIPSLAMTTKASASLALDSIDFYSGRTYVSVLVEREAGCCFYCLRVVNTATSVLDHVVAMVNGGGNSYMNVVAACHECNSLKQSEKAEDFLRILYRRGVLSLTELEARLLRLAKLRVGDVRPTLS